MPIELLIPLIIVLVILLFFSAIYSAAETAYTTLNMGKIETMIDNKEFGAKLIQKQYKFFNQTLVTILICNNIVNIASSTLLAYILSRCLSQAAADYNVLISTAVMTPVIVLLGEITPKLIAKSHPQGTAKFCCYIIQSLYYLFWPIAYPISKIGKKIYVTNSEEDVKNIIDVAQNEGVLETNESIMAQNALDLDSTKVKKHYIRMKDVSSINYDASVKQAQDLFRETNYSRIPVEKDNRLIGIVHLKDIFYEAKGKAIDYLKPVPIISSNSTLASALEKIRYQRAQMAFVTESNNTSDVIGIITIEDIIEEIVGEIYDEYDQEEYKDIFEVSLELFHVAGKTKMNEIIKQLEIEMDLNDEEYHMPLEAWLEKRLGHKLTKASRYQLNDVHFKVLYLKNKNAKDSRFEIELGNKADVVTDSNENKAI